MPDFGFIGGAYTSWSPNAAADVCMNLFPEKIENEGRYALYGTPGLTLFGTLPHSPVRGVWAGAGRLFAVGGSKLYEVASDGTATERGDVGNDGNPVQIFPNGTQLCVISNGHVWIDSGAGPVQQSLPALSGNCATSGNVVTWVSGDQFDATMAGQTITIGGTGFTVTYVYSPTYLVLGSSAVTSASVAFSITPAVLAASGAFLDTYFIASTPNTNQFNISDVNNASPVWNPIDFGRKEGYPDAIVGILADHEQLWLFGTDTTEVWQNTGAAAFPFERIPGAFIPHGCVSAWCPVRLADSVAWLAIDETRGGVIAVIATGFVPRRVSTHAVEAIWRDYGGSYSDIVSYTYIEQGHEFWVITFQNASATWVYDVTENLWHQRGWWDGVANVRQRGMFHAYCFNQHLVGDWQNGRMYQMSMYVWQDNGTAIHRIRAAQEPPATDMEWSTASRFRLYAEGSNLTPALDWSDSGGVTFNAPQPTPQSQNAGALAVYDWRRLGRYRSRVWRVTITDNAKVALIDGYVRKAA